MISTVYVLRVLGVQGRIQDPTAESPVGHFITGFLPLACGGLGRVLFSPHLHDALAFASMNEALGYYRQVPKHRPVKADGTPNRPLTALTVEVLAAGVRALDA